ncbi:MAG: stage IV sporulation protein A [Clostridia bacterium]|nr:stage IV sporulation protein A [Clostridia bacterium]MDD4375728.1 stage IV sporulation protein A [Clostridia bacterium]
MNSLDIYKDISSRTSGDIYIGVVGPVRTGKSTFIKNFMEMFIIPNIDSPYKQDRAKDELPQSAAGRTVMTTEPKFVPNESVEISLDNNVKMRTRLVDCVGYMINDAIGHMEGDLPRMVKTPWSDDEIPFIQAAETGTRKVITDHSTIGLVVTTDGSITDIERGNYVESEERVVRELKSLNKPFVVLLNSRNPEDPETLELRSSLEKKYNAPVITSDILNLKENDIANIFSRVLEEFPVSEIGFKLPAWFNVLDIDHPLKQDLISIVKDNFYEDTSIREINNIVENLKTTTNLFDSITIDSANMQDGNVKIIMNIKNTFFFKVLSEKSKIPIESEKDIFKVIDDYSSIKQKYDKIAMALEEVNIKGYGIVTPQIEELTLEEPEIVKQGSKYGVKLKASAPSIHMIKADIETEVSPIVGSEKQSEDLVKYLLSEFENDPKKIWESNIFGKSLHELVNEGLHNKLYRMPDEAQMKIQETLQRIINEGSGGLICIIL